MLLETAKNLKNRNYIKFYLVGDGRARERLENAAKKEKLNNVIFTGKVSIEEADRYIHFADCAYLSFKDNKIFNMTIPAKLQSYMACGTPILAAVGGESADIITAAECGIVCARNPLELSETIEKMASSRDNTAEMRKKAYEFYRRNYKKENLVDCFESLIISSDSLNSVSN